MLRSTLSSLVASSSSRSACRRTPARTPAAIALSLARRGLAGGGGESHVPVPQSAQARLWQGHPTKEGWESSIMWWYTSSFVLLVGIVGFSPDTEIQTWAKHEAQARLKYAQDELVFGTHYSNVAEERRDTTWDKFSTKALRMSEDDDDEDEEEDAEDADE